MGRIDAYEKGGIFIYGRMLAENNRLEKEIDTVQKRLEQLPEGKLVYASNGKYRKWYQREKSN